MIGGDDPHPRGHQAQPLGELRRHGFRSRIGSLGAGRQGLGRRGLSHCCRLPRDSARQHTARGRPIHRDKLIGSQATWSRRPPPIPNRRRAPTPNRSWLRRPRVHRWPPGPSASVAPSSTLFCTSWPTPSSTWASPSNRWSPREGTSSISACTWGGELSSRPPTPLEASHQRRPEPSPLLSVFHARETASPRRSPKDADSRTVT